MNYPRMRVAAAFLSAAVVALVIPAMAAMMAPPSISITSPAAGATIAGADIPVTVAVSNFSIECADVGKTSARSGQGHIHAMIDGMSMAHLTTVACTHHFTVSGQGLAPGRHVLTVVLANDAHAMNSLPASTSFTYAPARVRPLPSAIAGRPSLEIVSPRNGASVARTFDLVLAVQHFGLSCDLEGKPDVAGWGHVHVLVQQQGETSASPMTPMLTMLNTPEGMAMGRTFMQKTHMTMDQLSPMMSMAEPALIGMPCSRNIPVNLTTWHSGRARIVVQLANNDHMPTMGVAPATISVNVR